jgi:ssDNA-binding Zn-finger/Zn-ribbon topoisomerase 1
VVRELSMVLTSARRSEAATQSLLVKARQRCPPSGRDRNDSSRTYTWLTVNVSGVHTEPENPGVCPACHRRTLIRSKGTRMEVRLTCTNGKCQWGRTGRAAVEWLRAHRIDT